MTADEQLVKELLDRVERLAKEAGGRSAVPQDKPKAVDAATLAKVGRALEVFSSTMPDDNVYLAMMHPEATVTYADLRVAVRYLKEAK